MLSSSVFAVACAAAGSLALSDPEAAASVNYTLYIQNKCLTIKHFATYQIEVPQFTMNRLSSVLSLEPGKNGSITVPFLLKGVRLSGKGDQSVDAQWAAQPLVEFGYSEFSYADSEIVGTAFDLSMMEPSAYSDGLSVCPKNCASNCKTKIINTAVDIKQAWTDPDQVQQGSPADSLCSNTGKTDFDIVWEACS